ncbi:MAG: hypothetical protein QXL94_00185 [Candidatus Parvarchaeum sp.]
MVRFEIYEKEGKDFPPLKRQQISMEELVYRKEMYKKMMEEQLRKRLGLTDSDEVVLVIEWID